MTHLDKISRWIAPGAIGTEIGPGNSPLPAFTPPPIYVDCFERFGAEPCRADFFGDACRLPFRDNALDYVATSHVLEHVANPIAALAEWQRVLRPGGLIYLVVPDRCGTWEHRRKTTSVEHLLEDDARGTTACDATHIDEFVFDADWSLYSPGTAADDVPARQAELARGMHAAVARGEPINIHFHAFEPASLRELLEMLPTLRPRRFDWEIVDFAEGFPPESPNGILAIVRVRKGWHARAQGEALRIRAGEDMRALLREDAQPFAEWAARNAARPPASA